MRTVPALTKVPRRNRGESLTEVLVAIVVGGLAVLMLATVIAAAANTNQMSREAMDEYFAAANDVAAATSVDATGTVILTQSSDEEVIKLSDGDVIVNYTVSDDVQGTPIVSYERDGGHGE